MRRDASARRKVSIKMQGNKNGFKKGYIPFNKGKKVNTSYYARRKGATHWNWQGGITPLNEKLRKTPEYKLWRESVFKRDNWTCIWCGSNKSGTLNADHIKPFAYYPELRFAIDNGRTLCVECHRKTDTYLKRLIPKKDA